MNVIVVIPAHNEGKTIGGVVSRTLSHGRVIVVDDYSSDNTDQEASMAGAFMVLRNQINLGYDKSLDKGFAVAASKALKADIIVTMDGDGEHDPADIERIIKPIILNYADIVCGTRPTLSRWSETIFAFYTRLRFGIHDPLCGFKAYKREVYDAVGYFDRSNSIGTELMLTGVRKGYRVANVPIRLHPRADASRFYSSSLRGNLRILKALARGL